MIGIDVAIVVIALVVLFLGVRTVRIVPQARVGIIQLPKLAENPANKVLVVPTDYAGLAGLAATLGNLGADGVKHTGDGAGTSPSRVSARMPAGAPQALIQGEQPAPDKL